MKLALGRTASRGAMRMKKIIACALVSCVALQACSSRPREFTPTLAAAPADQAQFETAYTTCQQLLAAGKLDLTGRRGSAATGAAAGAGTAAVGGATAAAMGGYAGVAAASATIVLLPFAVVGGAWGMAKMKRARKERAIKAAIGECLHERGYEVAGWSRSLKKPIIARP